MTTATSNKRTLVTNQTMETCMYLHSLHIPNNRLQKGLTRYTIILHSLLLHSQTKHCIRYTIYDTILSLFHRVDFIKSCFLLVHCGPFNVTYCQLTFHSSLARGRRECLEAHHQRQLLLLLEACSTLHRSSQQE